MDKYSPQSDDIFSENLKPKKPWYKHWWLYAYVVIFITSIFILAAYSDTANKVFDAFSTDKVSETIADSIVNSSFTKDPDLETTTDIDYTVAYELLQDLDAPGIGNPDAPIQIVEFADFQCPFCQQAFPVMKQLIAKYSDQIYFVYADFPLDDIHPLASEAALAARCADEQGGFWQYHDSLFQNQDILDSKTLVTLAGAIGLDTAQFNTCMDSNKYATEVNKQYALGRQLGIVGTPTFFINGHKLPGVIPLDAWEQIISLVLYGVSE